jgi:hypothetical protein
VTDDGAQDRTDSTTAAAGRAGIGGTRMGGGVIFEAFAGSGAGHGAHDAADQAALAPLPRRRRLRGASGNRNGEAECDASTKDAFSI